MIILTKKKQRIQEKLDSINAVYGMLSPDESKAVEDSINAGIKFGEVEVGHIIQMQILFIMK